MSGWFNLILYITAPAIFYFYVGFVLFIIDFAITFGNTDTLLIQENLLLSFVLLILSLIYILLILFLFFKRGGETENKYGTTPVYDKKKQKVLRIAFTILTIITIISHGFVLLVF